MANMDHEEDKGISKINGNNLGKTRVSLFSIPGKLGLNL
jgi:hypothetical protein